MNDSAGNVMAAFLGLTPQAPTPEAALLSMGLALLLSTLVAVAYQFTFRGYTYSRSFIQSLVLGSIVTCMMIMAVGSNVARGLGILGTLTIIRFRAPIRDPRDAIFLFAGLGSGISCGAGGHFIATMGTLFFVATAFLLHWLPFASRREYEGMLRFTMKAGDRESEKTLAEILAQYTSSYGVLGITDAVQGEEVECSYQIRLIDPSYKKDLVSALKKDGRFGSPALILQRNTVEL